MTSPGVIVASGHMVDRPDRATPRFPAEQVPRVTREVRAAFDDWDVGPSVTLICGGARGTDIIAAEEALARGAQVVLCLARPPDELERLSVALPGTDWSDRFRRLLDRAEVRVLDDGASGDDVFARANAWMIDIARRLGEPRALFVWNGRAGDGPGGTDDFVRRLGLTGPDPSRVRVIDPTPRRYEARQDAPGPKRLLSLDGGGIRGVLSLEILAVLERQLRERAGDRTLVLGDWFDYIGGTSTGAIIASALALGSPVDELIGRYAALGEVIFRKQALHRRFRSLYRHEPLLAELEEMCGTDTTLGHPGMRTMLLIVLHNTETDSAWPLSNCTRATFNRVDRALLPAPDRNLDIRLVDVLRGSTAAPIYFQPQRLEIGEHQFLYQDGGITPFNNPAFLLYLMATLPAYGGGWSPGADQLLLVSVGTGSSAAVHPALRSRRVNLAFNARNLPSVFMNGASVGQDLLCRAVGDCRFGQPLDREVGDLVGAPSVGPPAFTYVRYDADLADEALAPFGVTGRAAARIRKLDAVERIDDLRRLGRAGGEQIDLDHHFRDFI